MSALDREKAREVATSIARGDYDFADDAVDAIEDCVHPFVWRDLEHLLEEHYPEDIFPVLPDDAERDLGPRLLSLVRLLHRQEAALDQIRRLCDQTIWIMSAKDVRPILDAVMTPEREDLTHK